MVATTVLGNQGSPAAAGKPQAAGGAIRDSRMAGLLGLGASGSSKVSATGHGLDDEDEEDDVEAMVAKTVLGNQGSPAAAGKPQAAGGASRDSRMAGLLGLGA